MADDTVCFERGANAVQSSACNQTAMRSHGALFKRNSVDLHGHAREACRSDASFGERLDTLRIEATACGHAVRTKH